MEFENTIDFGPVQDALNASLPQALFQGMEHIHTETTPKIPIETGNLRGSGEVEVEGQEATIFYPGPYALYQHEGVFYRHGVVGAPLVYKRGGGAFFLEKTLVEEGPKALDIVAEGIHLE